MAITISGENNNDKILASDGVIDQISGINIVGVITATSFTGDLTGNVTGNLTGNVNSTSPLLLQTGGSERIRLTSNNEIGIAGANYGSSGQVLTSGGSGSAVTWSAIPSQVNITNNADNRVITGGSGVNLNGEANLTFNGSKLVLAANSTAYDAFQIGNGLFIGNTTNNVSAAIFHQGGGADLEIGSQDMITFTTGNTAGNATERVRITSSGSVRIGGTTNASFSAHAAADDLVIGATSGSNGMTILTGSATGNIFFNDGSGNDGVVQYIHSSDPNYFRIASSGHVRFDAAAISISDDNIAPTAGDLSSGASFGIPKLHIRGNHSQTGAYELLARYQSGSDSNDTGATIVLNHSNDRGLALQGGRGQSNRSFGAIRAVDNIGRLSDCFEFLGGNGAGVNYIKFFTGESATTTERFRITSGGKILYGDHLNDRGAELQYEGSTHAGMGIHRNSDSHGAPAFNFSASRGTSAGSNTIVQENDYLGLIRFAGTDGTNSLASGAQITGIVDGTPGANDMPTRLGFWTSGNGSDSPTVRMTVTHEGQVAIGNEGADQTDVNLLVYGRGDNTDVATFSGGDYTRGLKIKTSANGGLNDQNVEYDAQGTNGQHLFRTDGTIVGRLEHEQSGFISENVANGDGDDEVGVALQNDYSAWGVIYKNDWIGNNQGWGTFWAGNSGAAYRRVSSDNNPNEHVMVGSGNKRFTFDLDSGGQAYFDGSLTQNAYDYAEYFEWEDGNPSNEDRRGYSVFVNSNGKIEKATDSTNATDIIGVISGTAAVVGDAAIYDWQGKWQVDEWGTLVTEVVKQVSWKDDDEEGKRHSYDLDKVPSGITIPSHASYRQHKRRILNPNYDESKEYIPRDMRQEWDPVGLLGKVRVRDDSPKNPNWKFIKTINGKKLWLIR